MNTVTPTTRTHNGGGTLLPVLILGCLALIYPLRAELMHALGIKFDVQSSTAMGTKVRVPDLTKYQKLDQSSVQSAANPADEPTGRREDKDRSVHAYQICADKAPADKWTVFRGLWSSNNSLHVLEAEILEPSNEGSTVHVLNMLAVVVDDSDETYQGIRMPHWNPLVMLQQWEDLLGALQCVWDNGEATAMRAVWFDERGHVLGLMLQCAVPPTSTALRDPASGFSVVIKGTSGSGEALNMCTNKYNKPMWKMVLCTTSQFPNPKIGKEHVTEWLEYHRLQGVEHVFFRDRTKVYYSHGIYEGGWHNATLQPYVDDGFVSYIPGPYHPPFDWGSVYSDQMYTNAACYMRLRHAAEWIEVQQPNTYRAVTPLTALSPQHLPGFLDALPTHVQEVALMHCRLMTIDATGAWVPHGRTDANHKRLVTKDSMRNCREDIPAGKSIGRARDIGFSHVHFLYPAVSVQGCAWRWLNASNHTAPPPSCVSGADYPARTGTTAHFLSYGVYDHAVGVNHGGGKWLNFRGFHGNATKAFINASLNEKLDAMVATRLGTLR